MSNEMTAINRNVQRSKELLVADLKRVVADADDLLKEMAHSTSDELVAAGKRIEAKLIDARARIDGARIDGARIVASQKACNAAYAANEYISDNPWKVVGTASLIGLVTAFILYHRSGQRD